MAVKVKAKKKKKVNKKKAEPVAVERLSARRTPKRRDK